MKPASGDDKKHPKRRDSALPPELRDLEKLVLALAEEFSFAGEKFEPLKKKTAGMIGAWRQREAGYRAEHHTSRAYLNGLTNGGVERWIAGSGNADMQQHFRRVWRDARTAPDADAPMKHIPLSPTPVEAQGKAAATAAAVAPNTTVTDASRQGGRI